MLTYLGNAKPVPECMADLSDEEWLRGLRNHYGDRIHIGPPRDGAGHTASYWESKGLVGVYLEGNV